jgi:hypothetical protein
MASNAPVKEPVLIWSAVAVVVVTLANLFGVVLDLSVVENAVAVIPVIVAAVVARSKVTPTP